MVSRQTQDLVLLSSFFCVGETKKSDGSYNCKGAAAREESPPERPFFFPVILQGVDSPAEALVGGRRESGERMGLPMSPGTESWLFFFSKDTPPYHHDFFRGFFVVCYRRSTIYRHNSVAYRCKQIRSLLQVSSPACRTAHLPLGTTETGKGFTFFYSSRSTKRQKMCHLGAGRVCKSFRVQVRAGCRRNPTLNPTRQET